MFPIVLFRGGQEEEWNGKTSHGTNIRAENRVLGLPEECYRHPQTSLPFHLFTGCLCVRSLAPPPHVECGG